MFVLRLIRSRKRSRADLSKSPRTGGNTRSRHDIVLLYQTRNGFFFHSSDGDGSQNRNRQVGSNRQGFRRREEDERQQQRHRRTRLGRTAIQGQTDRPAVGQIRLVVRVDDATAAGRRSSAADAIRPTALSSGAVTAADDSTIEVSRLGLCGPRTTRSEISVETREETCE